MISVVFDGRLGNQLFQYCVCRSIAERNHYDFHIPKITHQGTKSSLDNNFVKCDMGLPSCTWRSVYTETDNQPYNEKIFDINDYTLLFGFFQSETYFFLKHWPKVLVPFIILTRFNWAIRCMFGFGREVSFRSMMTPFLGVLEGVRTYRRFKYGYRH